VRIARVLEAVPLPVLATVCLRLTACACALVPAGSGSRA
tara:strand:+ start:655 stop:771 length:117 start_codon:yes stop_codon:yes gene_type:complete